MRVSTLLVAAVLAVFAAFITADSAFDPSIMRAVNSNPKSSWKAGLNKFASMNLNEVRQMLGAFTPAYTRYTEQQMQIIAQKQSTQDSNGNPTEFDLRQEYPDCIHPIRNQAHCGSCWAFAGSEAFSDNFCIASQGKVNVVFSPQDMVSCNWYNNGCGGGQLMLAWEYMTHTGLVPDTCMPYTSQNGTVESCPTYCVDGKTKITDVKYKMKKFTKVSPTIEFWNREKAIEDSLIAGHSIETGFSVYQDFLQYTSGVYQHVTGSFLGGHAVKIVGYGVDSKTGLKYWIVANSWGEDWGMNGFFWIKKGSNECGFEGDAYTGTPDLDHIPTH